MFKHFFKNRYKSRKTISENEANELQEKIHSLEEQIQKRVNQIEKFRILIAQQVEHAERYLKRIDTHNALISDHQYEIEKIRMILLDR